MSNLNFDNFKTNQNKGRFFKGRAYDPLIVIDILFELAEYILIYLLLGDDIPSVRAMAKEFKKGKTYICKLKNYLIQTLIRLTKGSDEINDEHHLCVIFYNSVIETTILIDQKNKKKKTSIKKISQHEGKIIKKELKLTPTIFLREIKDKLIHTYQIDVSISTLHKFISSELGFSKKKMSLRSPRKFTQENQMLKLAFIDLMHNIFITYGADSVIFLDETGVNLNKASRTDAWSQKGSNIFGSFLSRDKKHRINSICAFCSQGFLVVDHFQRSVNSLCFLHFIENSLVPVLRSNMVLILDNCAVHHGIDNDLRFLLSEKGVLFFYLPPYSPELNPIEMAFGVIKRNLKNYTQDFIDQPLETWSLLFDQFNEKQYAFNFFKEDYPYLADLDQNDSRTD
ncbi:integrase protein-related [Anaeramoeba ignava]|uniref:Integrase protein-related n=1 Tax=Anaeramoeba ignava TaxID=1746090 RepID=A0A9Q0LV76_ANAIG|nr:integrase protein-related [Anaeramoeba ignava]